MTDRFPLGTDPQTAALAAEVVRLWRSPTPSIGGVRRLAQTLLLGACDATSPAWLSGLPVGTDPSATERFAAEGPSGEGVGLAADTVMVLAASLRAGRAAAWLAAHLAPLRSEAEWLVTAALLTDAGRLRDGRPVSPGDARHVGRSAALVAACGDAPARLVRLIAAHHERTDGTGFPAGTTAGRLTTGERAVAAVVRFAQFGTSPADAAVRLHAEARGGGFDTDLTANFAWSVTGDLPTDGGFDCPAPHRWPTTDRGRRLRFDAAHPVVAAPHRLAEAWAGARGETDGGLVDRPHAPRQFQTL